MGAVRFLTVREGYPDAVRSQLPGGFGCIDRSDAMSKGVLRVSSDQTELQSLSRRTA